MAETTSFTLTTNPSMNQTLGIVAVSLSAQIVRVGLGCNGRFWRLGTDKESFDGTRCSSKPFFVTKLLHDGRGQRCVPLDDNHRNARDSTGYYGAGNLHLGDGLSLCAALPLERRFAGRQGARCPQGRHLPPAAGRGIRRASAW